MKKLIGCYNRSVILTYIGGASAVCGIYFSLKHFYSIAMICLVISAICDMFDGRIARRCKRDEIEKKFGIQIDSLTDTINFGILPVCICLNMYENVITLFISMIYIIAAITRLAWFNMMADKGKTKEYFIGLPTTYVALILPITYLINMLIFSKLFGWIYALELGIVAILFVLNFRMKKPYGVWYIFYVLLAILVIVGIILIEVL